MADDSLRKNPHWYCVDLKEQQWRTIRSNPICGELPVPEEYRGNGGQVVLRFRFRIPEDGEYTVMFNSPTSNQTYLDPAGDELRDDLHMLFGRQRLFPAMERPDGSFPCGEHPVIFSGETGRIVPVRGASGDFQSGSGRSADESVPSSSPSDARDAHACGGIGAAVVRVEDPLGDGDRDRKSFS